MKTTYTEFEQKLLRTFGYIILRHLEGDYDKTDQFLYSMGITNAEYSEDTKKFTIVLQRPGLLIGKRGELINHILKEFRKELKEETFDINIKETRLYGFMLPCRYWEIVTLDEWDMSESERLDLDEVSSIENRLETLKDEWEDLKDA
jgi:hypothetical protein